MAEGDSLDNIAPLVVTDGLIDDMTSKNISNCILSYTALPMKTDLHFQPTPSYLHVQNMQHTSIKLFLVSPQIVKNVVALTHFFFNICHTLKTR